MEGWLARLVKKLCRSIRHQICWERGVNLIVHDLGKHRSNMQFNVCSCFVLAKHCLGHGKAKFLPFSPSQLAWRGWLAWLVKISCWSLLRKTCGLVMMWGDLHLLTKLFHGIEFGLNYILEFSIMFESSCTVSQ